MTLAELEASLRAAAVRHVRIALAHDGLWWVSGVCGQARHEAHAADLGDAVAEFLDAARGQRKEVA